MDRNSSYPENCNKTGLSGWHIRCRYIRLNSSRLHRPHPYIGRHNSLRLNIARLELFPHRNNNPGFGSFLPPPGLDYYRRRRGKLPALRCYMTPETKCFLQLLC